MREQDTQSGLAVNFYPESDDLVLTEATEEYADIWRADGGRIVSTLERISGLKLKEKNIDAIVHSGGMSSSDPLLLGFAYTPQIKKGVIVHELVHRLIAGNNSTYEVSEGDDVFDTHKLVNLVLYDVWVELYGEEFARENVAYENQLMRQNDQSPYERAWNWALEMTREQRIEEFGKHFEDAAPPISWFTGIGKIKTGISIVFPNPARMIPGDESAQEEFDRHWNHYTNSLAYPLTDSDTPEKRQRVEGNLNAAQAFVTQTTGYSLEEIRAREIELKAAYGGMQTAPLEVLLFEFE